jgi:hypothetical protein
LKGTVSTKSSPPRSKEAIECSPPVLVATEPEPPPTFSATSSSSPAEVAVEAAAATVKVFCLLLITLDTPAPFIFFASVAAVTFLAVAFFALSSRDLCTFIGTSCSS